MTSLATVPVGLLIVRVRTPEFAAADAAARKVIAAAPPVVPAEAAARKAIWACAPPATSSAASAMTMDRMRFMDKRITGLA